MTALLFRNIWSVYERADNGQGMTRIPYPYRPVPLALADYDKAIELKPDYAIA